MRGILQGQGGKRYKTSQITGLAATVGWATANTVKLTWTNPTDVNFKGLVIRYKAGSYPTSPADGYAFYDSNDATPVATYTVTGANIVDGTTFYFRVFAYSYIGATKVYNSDNSGAQVTAIPYRNQGMQTFTASGTFTVPYGVNTIDVFLVGGGGGGTAPSGCSGSGGGGGYTKTQKAIAVTAGQTCSVTVGSGGNQNGTGGYSAIVVNGTTYSANGGLAGAITGSGTGGAGGSGGGACAYGDHNHAGGYGGSNGGSGEGFYANATNNGGVGQGTTTRAFDEAGGTLYAGAGGGGAAATGSVAYAGGAAGAGGGGAGGQCYATTGFVADPGVSGTPNTGGGGGGRGRNSNISAPASGTGGSGIVIIRWGY